jgi:hypothetical protein
MANEQESRLVAEFLEALRGCGEAHDVEELMDWGNDDFRKHALTFLEECGLDAAFDAYLVEQACVERGVPKHQRPTWRGLPDLGLLERALSYYPPTFPM